MCASSSCTCGSTTWTLLSFGTTGTLPTTCTSILSKTWTCGIARMMTRLHATVTRTICRILPATTACSIWVRQTTGSTVWCNEMNQRVMVEKLRTTGTCATCSAHMELTLRPSMQVPLSRIRPLEVLHPLPQTGTSCSKIEACLTHSSSTRGASTTQVAEKPESGAPNLSISYVL